MVSDTYCPIPWIFQGVRSNGDIRVCCQANISEGKGLILKEDGSSFNASRDLLVEARNAKMIKDLRASMVKGEWSPVCVRCEQEEKAGLRSRRDYENEQWHLEENLIQKHTDSDGFIDTAIFPVEYYDLRFGNLCNLACRMCGPTDSSAWYKDYVALTGQEFFHDSSGKVPLTKKDNRWVSGSEYDWHSEDHFWNEISKSFSGIKHIYMAGGEPLLIERHYEFLQKCIDENIAKNIILEYNTNLTVLPDRVLKQWKSFKQVRVGASIDGYGSVIEYQRYPIKWTNVLENLKKLNNQPENILGWVAYTVTAYNVFHITDFIEWKITNAELSNINRTKRRSVITHHVAHNPKHLNIRVLPEHLKGELTANFDNYSKNVLQRSLPDHVKDEVIRILKSVTKYMNQEDYHREFWPQFVRYTSSLDKLRDQSLTQVCPEFIPFFKE